MELVTKVGEKIFVKRKYAMCYEKYYTIGETSRSWIITKLDWVKDNPEKYRDRATKLPKVDFRDGNYVLGTERDAKVAAWASKHRYGIGRMVDKVTDPAVIIAVAKSVGYDAALSELEAL